MDEGPRERNVLQLFAATPARNVARNMATPAAAMDFSLPPAAPPGDVSAEAMEMQRSWLAAPPKKRRKKGRGATTKIKKPAEVPFDQLVHDVKYGQFARDVHRLNSNSSRFVTREQMRQSWESTVRMAHHRWARDYKGPGAGRADLGSKLLAEALAQVSTRQLLFLVGGLGMGAWTDWCWARCRRTATKASIWTPTVRASIFLFWKSRLAFLQPLAGRARSLSTSSNDLTVAIADVDHSRESPGRNAQAGCHVHDGGTHGQDGHGL